MIAPAAMISEGAEMANVLNPNIRLAYGNRIMP